MKLKELEPSTPVEHKIVLLLGMRGIKKNRLNFKGMHNDRFFSLIDEISWHDSDCGWQCYYQFAS